MDSPLVKLSDRSDKAKALKTLVLELKKGDRAEDGFIAQRSGSFIVAVFSTAITIAGIATVPPVIGGALLGACLTSAGGTLFALASEFMHRTTSHKELLAVLSSKDIKQWVRLWEMSGDTELFVSALEYACQGELVEIGGKEVFRHDDGRHPFDVAHSWIADGAGIDTSPQAQLSPTSVPVQKQQPIPVAYQSTPFFAPAASTPLAFERPSRPPLAAVRAAYTLMLDNPLECRAVFGAQRTGKSYFLAVVSQELHRQGTKIYHINLGSYGTEEDVYWSHCAKSVRGDISEMRAYEAAQLIDEAIALVDEFYAQEDAILIFDEWVYVGKKNNIHAKALQPLIELVADRAGILTQTGVKRSKAIWTVAPEFVAGLLTESAKVIKSFPLLYVTIAPGRTINWTNPSTGKSKPVKFSTSLFDQIDNNYEIVMPVERFAADRICYIDNEWIEVGDLPPLDPNLRPHTTATLTATQSPTETEDSKILYLAERTQEVNIWEFAKSLGVRGNEDLKRMTLAIAELFESERPDLLQKFNLRNVFDVRYAYLGYSAKVREAHQATGNMCCCCLERESSEVHHTDYQGELDQKGVNQYPVCSGRDDTCHEKLCHSFTNWIKDRENPVWGNHNTEEWKNKLRSGYEYHAKRLGGG